MPQIRLLLAVHLQHLTLLATVDPRRRPPLLPVRQPGVLSLDRLELAALQGRALRVLDRILDRPLAVRVPDPAGIRHHPVVLQHLSVERVQLRLVDVRTDHPFLQVVQHHVLRHAAEAAPCLLVQPAPDFLVRLPHRLAEALARVLQRHHEQIRAAVIARSPQRQRALPVVHLALLARQVLQHVEPLRLPRLQLRHEPLDEGIAESPFRRVWVFERRTKRVREYHRPSDEHLT